MANDSTTTTTTTTMDPRPLKYTYIAVELVIALLAVFGNALVIVVVKRNRGLRSVTFCCIVSLALADMAVGLIVIPMSVVVSMEIKTHFYVCLFMCCTLIIFTNASILSLLAIAVDRYLRIRIPTRYKIVTTEKNIWICLGTCWIVSLIVGLIPMFGWNLRAQKPINISCHINCTFTAVMSMEYMVYFNFFGWVLLPLLVIWGLYFEIFCLLRKHLRKNLTASKKRNGTFYGREYKTAKSLTLVLFLFALCWLPLSLCNCLLYFVSGMAESTFFPTALYFSILLSHANSAMNPVVYAFKIQKFRETYRDIVCVCTLQKASDSNSGSDDNSVDPISQA